jgi:hypothetical protein
VAFYSLKCGAEFGREQVAELEHHAVTCVSCILSRCDSPITTLPEFIRGISDEPLEGYASTGYPLLDENDKPIPGRFLFEETDDAFRKRIREAIETQKSPRP